MNERKYVTDTLEILDRRRPSQVAVTDATYEICCERRTRRLRWFTCAICRSSEIDRLGNAGCGILFERRLLNCRNARFVVTLGRGTCPRSVRERVVKGRMSCKIWKAGRPEARSPSSRK